jgi:hypothetical protein
MENILQLNSNTFFIDRKSDDYSIIENYLLKKASEYSIKDVEEIEIVISAEYEYDIDFKTREGSFRIKEAGMGSTIKNVGSGIIQGLVSSNSTPRAPLYDQVAGNPIGKFLSSGNIFTSILGAASGYMTGGVTGALTGFLSGSSSGVFGLLINAGLAASGMGGVGLLISAGLTAIGSATLNKRNEEIGTENRALYQKLIESGTSEEEAKRQTGYKPTPEEIQAQKNKEYADYAEKRKLKALGYSTEDANVKLSPENLATLNRYRQKNYGSDYIEFERNRMLREQQMKSAPEENKGLSSEEMRKKLKEEKNAPKENKGMTSEELRKRLKKEKNISKKITPRVKNTPKENAPLSSEEVRKRLQQEKLKKKNIPQYGNIDNMLKQRREQKLKDQQEQQKQHIDLGTQF